MGCGCEGPSELVLAKRRKLVDEVRPILERMRTSGYFLSNALVEAACESVGEGSGR